ncbi:hypothetical protein BDW22DRAFT_1210074 [Trametopsis cervina]|nr:hypothetical protein BDW22DRAFT_1210074 [Trametopsis cervina]
MHGGLVRASAYLCGCAGLRVLTRRSKRYMLLFAASNKLESLLLGCQPRCYALCLNLPCFKVALVSCAEQAIPTFRANGGRQVDGYGSSSNDTISDEGCRATALLNIVKEAETNCTSKGGCRMVMPKRRFRRITLMRSIMFRSQIPDKAEARIVSSTNLSLFN